MQRVRHHVRPEEQGFAGRATPTKAPADRIGPDRKAFFIWKGTLHGIEKPKKQESGRRTVVRRPFAFPH